MQNLDSVAQKMSELYLTRIARPYRGLANLAAPQGFASLRAHYSNKEYKGLNTNVPLASLRYARII